jgi:hypothetical protein
MGLWNLNSGCVQHSPSHIAVQTQQIQCGKVTNLTRIQELRAAIFTTLQLTVSEEQREAISLLLHWPTVLNRFRVSTPFRNPHCFNPTMVENWSLIHQDSITHIDLGFLYSDPGAYVFHVTLFRSLGYLRVSRWQISTPVKFLPEHSNVLSPKLRNFSWDFTLYNATVQGWRDIEKAEAQWLQELAEHTLSHKAASQRSKYSFSQSIL